MSGRIRTIKPELLEDVVTAGISDAAFRLYVGAILLSDDFGNFRAEPRKLRADIFWAHSSVTVDTVETLLTELAEAGCTATQQGLFGLYRVRGQVYGHIRNWEKHQKISHRGAARLPKPTAEDSEQYSPSTRTFGASPEATGQAPALTPNYPTKSKGKTEQYSPSTPNDHELRDPPRSGPDLGSRPDPDPHPGNLRSQSSFLEESEQFRPSGNNSGGPPEVLRLDLRSPISDLDHDHRPSPLAGTSAEPTFGFGSPPNQPRPSPPSQGTANHALFRPDPQSLAPEREVFEHWLASWKTVVCGIRTPRLDEKRRKKITARLREKFSVDELKLAVEGIWASTWHVENKHYDISVACRDSANVERFMTMAPSMSETAIKKASWPPLEPEPTDDELAPMSPDELAEFDREMAELANAKTLRDAGPPSAEHGSNVRLRTAPATGDGPRKAAVPPPGRPLRPLGDHEAASAGPGHENATTTPLRPAVTVGLDQEPGLDGRTEGANR